MIGRNLQPWYNYVYCILLLSCKEQHTTNLEMKQSLYLSSIESSSKSEEGNGGQQMPPKRFEQSNFSEIHTIHIYKSLRHQCINQVFSSYHGNRQNTHIEQLPHPLHICRRLTMVILSSTGATVTGLSLVKIFTKTHGRHVNNRQYDGPQ